MQVMAKIICDYCESGTKDELCYKGGMEKCQGELFLAKAQKLDASENTLPIHGVVPCLFIKQCKDPMMWYADKVGQAVEFIREDRDGYWSRDKGGYLNIVKKTDAVVIK
jgi:hypothetical protein